MRNRMRRSCSDGSTWMSDARSPNRLGHEQVHELDDRRVLDELGDAAEVVVLARVLPRRLLHHRVDVVVDAVEALDGLVDLRRGRDDGAHLGAGDRADVVDRENVRRVGHRDDEAAVFPTDRDRLVPAGERLGDHRRDRRVDDPVVEVDELEADLTRERTNELGFGDRARLDEQPSERLPATRLLREGRVELRVGQQPLVDEQGAERCRVAHWQSSLSHP